MTCLFFFEGSGKANKKNKLFIFINNSYICPMKRKKTPKGAIKLPNYKAFAKRPHDQYARFVLQIRVAALAFLRFVLPDSARNLIDFDSLQLSSETFVDSSLRSHLTDICYVGNSNTDTPFRIAIIVEHKSYAPHKGHLIAQLLRYISNIWQSDVRNNRPLTFTLPIVLYHGPTPLLKEELAAIFEHIPAELRHYLPNLDFLLLDINQIDDTVIEQTEALLRNFFYTLKYARNESFIDKYWEKMLIFAPELRDKQPGTALFLAAIFYLSYISETFNSKFEDMQKVLNVEEQRTFKTFFEVFVDENKDKWLSEGLEKGMEKGMEKGIFQLLSTLIKKNPSWTNEYLAELCNLEIALVMRVREQIQGK
jgi:predicted transposase/invertase (TIGR01784 family)